MRPPLHTTETPYFRTIIEETVVPKLMKRERERYELVIP